VELISYETTADYRLKLKEFHDLLDKINNFNTVGKLKMFNISPDELEAKFSAYLLCRKIMDIKNNAEKFESLIGYLNSAKTYIIDKEEKLITDINNTIGNLANVLQSEDSNEIRKYDLNINSLIDKYADYYMTMAVDYYISANDEKTRNELLNSDTKKICDIIKDINIINSAQYYTWIDNLTALKTMPISFTKANIRQDPNIGFNPREHVNKFKLSVSSLASNLRYILENWTESIIAQLNDPTVKNNFDLLDNDEKILVENLIKRKDDIEVNNALKIRDIVNKLTQSFEKVEINTDDVKQIMQKPLTPKEAIEIFTDFVERKCSGKDRTKVKIIIK